MKGPLGFGGPKQHRISMQFGYNTKPSFWQQLQTNSHLVIAAVGTAALLGVAGIALWLALPTGERQAFAEAKHPPATEAPAPQAKTVQVAGQTPAATPAVADAKPQPAQTLVAVNQPASTEPSAVNSNGTSAPQSAAAIQEAAKAVVVAKPGDANPDDASADDEAATDDTTQSAYAETNKAPSPTEAVIAKPPVPHAKPDKALTAGIPPADETQDTQEAAPADAKQAKATGNGTTLRAVTMRSGPKKGADAIATVPGKAAVEVISCTKAKWCEIVYQNKRGWIYQGFLNRG